MIIYILRHTKPIVPQATFYGHTDMDIVPGEFREKVKILEKILPMEEINQVYSSPLKRCYKLAKKLTSQNDIITDDRIKELNFGDWEMKSWEKMDQSVMEDWFSDFVNKPTPNGESHLDMYHRAKAFWLELITKRHDKVLVVTHAGIIRSLLAFVLDMPLKKSFSIKLHYNHLIKIEHIEKHHYNVEFLTC